MIVWKVNGLFKADPEQVYREITQLGEQYTPEQVVEIAKDEKTQLHGLFEWDDSKAAHKYRITQAQLIIRALVYVSDTARGEREAPKIRAIVQSGVINHYAEISVVAKNNDQYNRLLEDAKRDAAKFMEKYRTLAELEEVLAAMRSLLEG